MGREPNQDAHRKLNGLIEGIGAYADTMRNLHYLLKTSFPVRFTENDSRVSMTQTTFCVMTALLLILATVSFVFHKRKD